VIRKPVDQFIDGIELAAAGFLAVVTAITFVSVFLRYFLAWSIPDGYDFSCLLLGVLIFWGMAVASYRGDHITVDLIWSLCGVRLRRAMDLFASLVTLASMAVFTWMAGTKVISTRADNVLTFDLHLPVWIFYLIAWLGLAASILLLVARTIRLVVRPDALERQTHLMPTE
jgi:TRAP-type C4-dicarboxylate transport system permease small subunit